MGKFVDFQLIKREVSFADAIELLEMRMTFAGNQWRGNCPACGTKDGRSLVVTAGEGWFCHSADTGGDVIALAKHILDLGSMRDAAFELAERAGISTSQSTSTGTTVPRNRSRERQEPESERHVAARPRGGADKASPHTFNPDRYAESLDYEHELLLESGGDPAKLKAAGIGFCNRGLHRGRIVIRVVGEDGDISFVGVEGALHLPSTLKTTVVPFKKRA